MSLNTEREIHQTWGSHQPLLRALVEVVPLRHAVECGCGNYSTPILRDLPELLSIEHDAAWAATVGRGMVHSSAHRWLVQEFSGVNNGTPLEDLTNDNLRALMEFYRRVSREISNTDLLFVDSFRVARTLAVAELSPKARMVLLHDMEPPSPDWYGYGPAEEILKAQGRVRYLFKPSAPPVNQAHQVPWTAIYSKDPLPIEKILEVSHPASMSLWGHPASLEEWPW